MILKNKYRIVLFLTPLILGVNTISKAQTTFVKAHYNYWSGPTNEVSLKQTSDAGYIVGAGFTDSSLNKTNIHLTKTDQFGDTTWMNTFTSTSADLSFSRILSTTGGFTLSGTYISTDTNIFMVRTNGNGTIQWSKTYGGTGAEKGKCIQRTNDGGYVCAALQPVLAQALKIFI
jgi:hypothetical protein